MKSKLIIIFLLSFMKILFSQTNLQKPLPLDFIEYITKTFNEVPPCSSEPQPYTPYNEYIVDAFTKTSFGSMDTAKVSLIIKEGNLKKIEIKHKYSIYAFVEDELRYFFKKYNNYKLFKDGKYSFYFYFLVLNKSKDENYYFNFCIYKNNAFWSISTQVPLDCRLSMPPPARKQKIENPRQ